jgi:hypothetical protein
MHTLGIALAVWVSSIVLIVLKWERIFSTPTPKPTKQ